jgi:hypothetical protein
MTVLVEGMPSAWLQQTGAARAEQQRRAFFFCGYSIWRWNTTLSARTCVNNIATFCLQIFYHTCHTAGLR